MRSLSGRCTRIVTVAVTRYVPTSTFPAIFCRRDPPLSQFSAVAIRRYDCQLLLTISRCRDTLLSQSLIIDYKINIAFVIGRLHLEEGLMILVFRGLIITGVNSWEYIVLRILIR
jgi:hypothetical protein